MKKITYKISLVFALLLFVIPLIYVVFCMLNGYLILPRLFMFYFVISLIAFGLAAVFVFVKAVPNCIKVICTAIILVCTFVFCFLYQGILGNIEFDIYRGIESINKYNENLPSEDSRNVYEPYIETDSYGEYEDIVHYHYFSTGLFWQHAESKILKYNSENFKKETERINTEMSFYEKAVEEDEPVPVFTIEGFDFRLRKECLLYPKEMYFVGINEARKEIAYVEFSDYDLDSVWEFYELLNNDCGWDYIIKDREKAR